jgi:hypothetical protein
LGLVEEKSGKANRCDTGLRADGRSWIVALNLMMEKDWDETFVRKSLRKFDWISSSAHLRHVKRNPRKKLSPMYGGDIKVKLRQLPLSSLAEIPGYLQSRAMTRSSKVHTAQTGQP